MEFKQELAGEEQAREKESVEEEKELLRKLTVKELEETFADLKKLLKMFENINPSTILF